MTEVKDAVPGLSPGPSYTLADVDVIEAARGRDEALKACAAMRLRVAELEDEALEIRVKCRLVDAIREREDAERDAARAARGRARLAARAHQRLVTEVKP